MAASPGLPVHTLPYHPGAPPPVTTLPAHPGQVPLISLLNAQVAAWNHAHPNAQLDQRAVDAVASMEGLGGGIGDNGTSFGAFQLHYGGAYPSFAPRGPAASQAWAWSPAGLQYALSKIAGVAGGLRGASAVQNIVSRFERPANIQREIAGALSRLGHTPSSGTSYSTGTGAPAAPHAPAGTSGALGTSTPAPSSSDLSSLLAALQSTVSAPAPSITTGFDALPALSDLLAPPATAPAPLATAPAALPIAVSGPLG